MGKYIGSVGCVEIKEGFIYSFNIKGSKNRYFGFVDFEEDEMAYSFVMQDSRFPVVMIYATECVEEICSMKIIRDECLHFGELKKLWIELKGENN